MELSHLNRAQQEAVTAPRGPLAIIAGPGSGKTRVLTYRALYAIEKWGLAPERVLAITFTNKAADELRERLGNLVPQGDKIFASTMHSFAARMLRYFAPYAAISQNFVIYDDDDSQGLIEDILKQMNIDVKKYRPADILGHISAAKARMYGAEDFAQFVREKYGSWGYYFEVVHQVFLTYEQVKERCQALDFDDLIMVLAKRLAERPELRDMVAGLFDLVLVDEFQDTNLAQYEMLLYMTHPQYSSMNNVTVVGDPDQSIYGFRAAEYYNIKRFIDDYAPRVVFLDLNYRSHRVIVDAASALINDSPAAVFQRHLESMRDTGPKILLRRPFDDNDSAITATYEVGRLHNMGIPYEEIAILMRTRALTARLEREFTSRGIPYHIIGGLPFFARREIKDILAYLRLSRNTMDRVSLKRILTMEKRGLGPASVDKLVHLSEEQGVDLVQALRLAVESMFFKKISVNDYLERLYTLLQTLQEISDSGQAIDMVVEQENILEHIRNISKSEDELRERLDNLSQLRSIAEDTQSVDELLQRSALGTREINGGREGVAISTVHGVKGLEFTAVILYYVVDGMFPHSLSITAPEKEEERRLLYVAMTRAKEHLIVYVPYKMPWRGGWEDLAKPSPFLCSIPEHLWDGKPYEIQSLYRKPTERE
ncbi:UvrD-helicase domain-containing protein [Coprothermobacteraceae bacterium]|nr:UvrD-helicase domain-containing protein [Coprothermobacteraceae bacterium]